MDLFHKVNVVVQFNPLGHTFVVYKLRNIFFVYS